MQDKPYIYDEELQRVSSYSYYDFLKTLSLLQSKNTIDVNKSAKIPYTLITEAGETLQYVDWYTMFPRLEEDLGIEHDPLKSFKSSETYVLYMKSPLLLESVSLDLETISEEQEDVVEDISPLISIDLDEIEEEEEKGIDWDYVDSLYDDSDKRTSKDNLEEYARQFDVELAKNKSFQNMVKDFRKAVK